MLLRKKALFFGKIRAQEIRNSLLTKISLRNMLLFQRSLICFALKGREIKARCFNIWFGVCRHFITKTVGAFN